MNHDHPHHPNPHMNDLSHLVNNGIRSIWGKAMSTSKAYIHTCNTVTCTAADLSSRGGHVLNTIRKQSRIKLNELQSNLDHGSGSGNISGGNGVMLASTAIKKKRRNNTGFYYGIRDDIFFPDSEGATTEDADDNSVEDETSVSPSDRDSYSGSRSGSTRSHKRERDERMGQQYGGNDNTNSGTSGYRSPSSMSPSSSSSRDGDDVPSTGALSEIMGETLYELREMREDIMGLREEMQYLKEEFKQYKDFKPSDTRSREDDRSMGMEDEGDDYEYPEHQRKLPKQGFMESVKRKREYEAIAQEVEKWSHKLLFEEDGEEFGWKEVKCNKMVRKKFNKDGNTRCYMKWLKDSRGKHATLEENQEYPCIKCYTTFDAPLEEVCEYLSQESHMPEYNDLVVAYRDVEDITPSSKITWSQCPQILFIKPRDFVTYCSHRWRKDGTQIVVSQACDHADTPGNEEESNNKPCRAYALRGANFISRDPTDPDNKTRMAILAHAHAGGGVPAWAMKTAVNAVAPIEPFKLFSRIEKRVEDYCQLNPSQRGAASVNSNSSNHHGPSVQSSRPAGLSQLGYACFWPEGGGHVGHKAPESKADTISVEGDY